MENFVTQLLLILSVFGYLLRALGFGALGFGLGRFMMDAYKQAAWQLQIALALGFFALIAAITRFTGPTATGAFAAGLAIPLIMAGAGKKEEKAE